MLIIDLHVYTEFSCDSEADMEAYVKVLSCSDSGDA